VRSTRGAALHAGSNAPTRRTFLAARPVSRRLGTERPDSPRDWRGLGPENWASRAGPRSGGAGSCSSAPVSRGEPPSCRARSASDSDFVQRRGGPYPPGWLRHPLAGLPLAWTLPAIAAGGEE
jgi:hypothetical protein